MKLHGDFKEFLELLIAHQVRYLLVGAQALAIHGRPRFTGDLDIWVDRSPANAQKLVQALADFGFQNIDPKPFTEHDRVATLGREPVRVDIFTYIPGPAFSECYARRLKVPLGEHHIDVLSKTDFIASKKASGRTKDLLDLELLAEAEGKKE